MEKPRDQEPGIRDQERTEVVRTPQSSALEVQGAGGVSMNSNPSGDWGWIFDI
jgi:hypothetical protein